MSIYYLATSAIVKRYIDEPGTVAIDHLFEATDSESGSYTSFLSMLEFTSVMTRGANSGRLERVAAATVLAKFHRDSEVVFRLWPLDASILRAAVAVVENHALRPPTRFIWRRLPRFSPWPRSYKAYWFPSTGSCFPQLQTTAWACWTPRTVAPGAVRRDGYMVPSDTIEVEISGIGTLRN